MTKKRKITKRIFLGAAASVAFLPALSVMSCGYKTSLTSVTLAQPAATSMNFIRYKTSSAIAAPSVYPLINQMPFGSVKNKYQLSPLFMKDEKGSTMSSNSITYGAMRPDSEGETYVLDQSGRNITIILRNGLKWSNGDKLVAQNWVDTMKAMLDFNQASEYVYDIERLGIENAQESYYAQETFLQNYKYVYHDPFNYENRPVATSEAQFKAEPGKYFPQTLVPCLGLGIEADGDNKLLLHFNHKESLHFFSSLESPIFWPINRKHIMSHGGFDQFGKTAADMPASGAYMPTFFDGKYGVEFSKNMLFHREDQVITPNIVFRFIKNENTKAIAYRNHQILSTQVNKEFLPSYLSDESLRNRLKRVGGIGTIGLFLNSYKARDSYDAMSNINFRKALEYGINRSEFLSSINLDFSNPVSVYTASASFTADAQPYLQEFVGTKYTIRTPQTVHNDVPFMNTPIESRSYAYAHDNFSRKDLIYNKDIAKEFLDKAKQELGADKFPVVLHYPYSTADNMGKSISVILQNFLKTSFGDAVRLESRALPNLVYQSKISQGDWDIRFKQVDPLTRSPWDYLGEFVVPDAPSKEEGKTVGYLRNNNGDYTYTKYFTNPEVDDAYEAQLKKDYDISDFDFDVTKWIATYTKDFTDTTSEVNNYKLDEIVKKYATYFTTPPSTDLGSYMLQKRLYNGLIDFRASVLNPLLMEGKAAKDDHERRLIFDRMIQAKSSFVESSISQSVSFKTIYKTLEKIQRDMVPVIPIAEADCKWIVSRIGGSKGTPSGHYVNPMYLYDLDNKPYEYLESKE